jgi:hypothetical protein
MVNSDYENQKNQVLELTRSIKVLESYNQNHEEQIENLSKQIKQKD